MTKPSRARATGILGASVILAAVASVQACGGSTPSFGPPDSGVGEPTKTSAEAGESTGEGPSLGGDGGGTTKPDPNSACAATETAAIRAQVDIIIAIDTSGSMGEETEQVRQNINTFAQAIGNSGLDYQVILVAAKKGQQPPWPFPFPNPIPDLGLCVPPPLGGPSCADNPPKFHHVAKEVASTDGFSVLLATYDADWKKWLRQDAWKVFIGITDDDSDMTFQTFDQQLLAKAPAGMFGTAASRKYIFNSICGWKDGTPVLDGAKCSTAVNIGKQWQELSKLTSGIVDSVCKTSYAGVFDNIAKGLVTKLGCEFAMPKPDGGTADPDKVVVQYTAGSGPNAGKPTALTQVTDASKCAQIQGAWYYDNNAAPSKIIFCPATCTSAGNDTGGKIGILLGCKGAVPQ